jgi:hypothetical protein
VVLPRLIATHLSKGDALALRSDGASLSARAEILIRKPNLKRFDVYQGRTGYATQPKPDRRGELCVRADVIGRRLGIAAIHIPCHVIHDYFFAVNRNLPWAGQESLYLPERRHRTFAFPLRRLDFFSDHAILRDSRRKLEVLIDHQLLPLKWDQTWSRWRHLISTSIEISAGFLRTGKYRKRDAEWRLEEWETALPSTTEITVPSEVHESILRARNAHSRFGRYFDEIDRLRWHVQQIPTECDELRRRCWGYGLPGDFDVKQITWRPDYDQYYYNELSKRALTMYLFRDEYIFDLERCVVVEVPQAGHATYVFPKPSRLQEFIWQYAKTTRQEILANRHNIAQRLGFVGRVVHESDNAAWLKELRPRIGESEPS